MRAPAGERPTSAGRSAVSLGCSRLHTASYAGRPAVVAQIGPAGITRTFGAADGDLVSEAARRAAAAGVPLVISLSCRGLHVGDGLASCDGLGRAARAVSALTGVVPVLAVVSGRVSSEVALLVGLADIAIMTADARLHLSSAVDVRRTSGIGTLDWFGDPHSVTARAGVAQIAVPSHRAVHDVLSELLGMLPDPVGVSDHPPHPVSDPPDRPCPDLNAVLPDDPAVPYDVRRVVDAVVDDRHLLEISPDFAPNVVCAFARVAGRTVGVVANQPQVLAGTLDVHASCKAARFVELCDRYGIPLVTFVDTPGFLPGRDQEWRGMIRHGSKLAFAYARTTVPRVCVILRKAYGGAYIVMDSKPMGSDLTFAWPTAEIAVMGPEGAARIVGRGASPEELAELTERYRHEHLNSWRAAERGLVDDVIEPSDTRRKIAAALRILEDKVQEQRPRRHDNHPL
ncbi:MAG: methylmalonyl-CoA carboxyltransferase [Acidimicrobiales bacterium]|nr:MAG: methylmalonyl-CoA carboxyltransferase [Acidimicrobiales bacterium]